MDDSKGTLKQLLEKIRDQNKTDLLFQGLQTKYEREQAGEDNDKREKQLESVIENLKKIEKAISGNSEQVKVLPKNIAENLNVKLSDIKVPEEEKTFTEDLKELVGGFKSGFQTIERGINNTFNKGFKFLSDPLGSIKEGIKNITSKGGGRLEKAKEYIKDVASTKAGFTAEEGRFVEEYKKQKKASSFGVTKEEEELLSEKGTAGFRETKDLEQKIKAAEADIQKSTKFGFAPTPEDQQKLEELKKLKSEVDVRGKDKFAESVTEAKFKPEFFIEPKIQPPVQTPTTVPEQRLEKVQEKQTKNEEADNVVSAQESIADSFKENNELIKQLLTTTKDQLDVVKNIKESLTPKSPEDQELSQQKKEKFYGDVTNKLEEISDKLDSVGGGSLGLPLPGLPLPGLPDIGGPGGKGKDGKTGKPGKAGGAVGAAGRFSKLASIGNIGGSILSVAGGAYTAYEGYTSAEDSKNAKLEEVQAKVNSGEINEKQAAQLRKEIGNTATVEKGGALGKGAGSAAGGIAGMKLGATLGMALGPVGSLVGGVAGGALGYFAGGAVGEKAGELGGKVMNYFTGDKKPEVPAQDSKGIKSEFKGTMIADEPVVPGKPLSEKQMAVIKMSKSMGNSYSPEIEAQYAKQSKTVSNEQSSKIKADEKDYTKDPKYQKILQEEQEVIKGRNVRTAGEGREASETLSVSQVREAEREAKNRYIEQTGPKVQPAPSRRTGADMATATTENTDLNRDTTRAQPSAPVIMNNSSSNNNTSYVPMKPTPRPEYTGSALDRYQSRISTY